MKNLMDAKIDAYIAINPKHWRGIQAMAREHLERTLVALYVQRQEAHERKKAKSSNAELSEPGGPAAFASGKRVAPPGFAPVSGSAAGRK